MKRFPIIVAAIYALYWTVLAIAPVSRAVWWAENIPALGVFIFLAVTYGRFRFSNTAYTLMGFWLFWHTLGGHYTFANVPFDWFNELIGAQRNHFDRIGHFSVGFYAYAIAEYLLRRRLCGPMLATLFALFSIMAVACGYEIIEWWYAVLEGGDAGIEFLGSQGDIWDAQKDMLLDTLGAVSSLGLYHLIRPDKSRLFR